MIDWLIDSLISRLTEDAPRTLDTQTVVWGSNVLHTLSRVEARIAQALLDIDAAILSGPVRTTRARVTVYLINADSTVDAGNQYLTLIDVLFTSTPRPARQTIALVACKENDKSTTECCYS